MLTPGKYEPRDARRESTTPGSAKICCIETRKMAPMMGPTTVPKPPMTVMMRGKKELAGEKMELSTNVKKYEYSPPAMPAKKVLMTNAMSLYFAVLIPIIFASASFPCIALKASPIRDLIIRYIVMIDAKAKEITKM